MKKFVVILALVAAVTNAAVRGVHPDEASKYVEGSDFQCTDGSKTVTWQMINDDYCDCADGSDEPGTSACPNSHFYCKNQGYKSSILSSSFVDDGVCDCCDGSDEKSGLCPNECGVHGETIRKQLVAEAELHTQGYELRKQIQAESIVIVDDKRRAADALRQEMARRQVLIDELKARLAPIDEVVSAFKAQLKKEQDAREAEFNEKLALAKQVEKDKQIAEGVAEESVDLSNVVVERDPEPVAPEIEEEKEQASLQAQLEPLEREQRTQQREVDEFDTFLNSDFGPNHEWAALKDRCFKEFIRTYQYEVCLFSSAKQGTTDIGRFTRWEASSQMYENGQRCWQGPNRSAKVKMVCGLEHKITSVEEPETCKYHLEFATPMACSAEHAQVIRLEIDGM